MKQILEDVGDGCGRMQTVGLHSIDSKSMREQYLAEQRWTIPFLAKRGYLATLYFLVIRSF